MTTYINPGNNTGLYGLDDIVINTGYGNANVESFLATGSDTGGNIVGNIVAAGNISAAGNITADYFIGDGSQLTNVGSYGNSNVATLLASFGSNTISTTGNITGGYIFGNGSGLTGLPATYANANVATFLANFGSNTISTTGNITGGNLIGTHVGSGAALSSITGANVTGTVANATYATSAGTATSATTAGTVTTAAQPNITSVGTLTSLTVSGNATIAGNLTVSGNTYVANVQTLEVQDPIIGLGRGPNNTPLTSNDGKDRGVDLWYYTTSEQQAFVGYDNSAGKMIMANNVSISNEVVTVNDYGTTVVGTLEGTRVSVGGNVTGGNLTTSGLITGVGNITGGNLITGGLVNASASITAGTTVAAGQGITAGTTISAVGNVTGANINTAGIVSAVGNVSGGNISTVGNVTGAYIKGDGSQLTNLNVPSPATLTQDLNTLGYKIYNSIAGGNLTLESGSAGNISMSIPGGSSAIIGSNGVFQLNGLELRSNYGVSVIGNVTGGNIRTAGVVSTGGNVIGGNITTTGQISSTGNITSAGNITGGNLISTTGVYTGLLYATSVDVNGGIDCTTLNATGNISAGGSDIFAGNIRLTGAGQGIVTATGNVQTSSYFVGDGTYLTNVPAVITGNLAGNLNGANTYSINNLQDLTINPTGGNISIGAVRVQNFNNRWYFATDTDIAGRLYATGNLLTDANVVATANVIGGNISTAGQVTATGNVSGGNIVVPINGRYRGDFSSAVTSGRTVFQTTSTGTSAPTFISAAPGPNHVAGPTTIGSATGLSSSNDLGNASVFGMYSLGSEARIWSLNTGTGNVNNMTFRFNSTANLGATLSSTGAFSAVGNVTGANINTAGLVSATGNVISGNIVGPAAGTGVGIINYKDYVYTLTYASTITPDAANGSIQQVTLTGNVTLNAFGGTPQAGQSILVKFIQDGTGGRTLSSTMKWAGGSKTLSTAANAVDIASIFYDGSTYYASLTTNYS